MGSTLGGSGNGGIWGMGRFHDDIIRKWQRRSTGKGGETNSAASDGGAFRFPVKQAATAASLAFTGDTIAQLRQRWVANKGTFSLSQPDFKEDIARTLFSEHDWIRALRMTSYGFLLYGPGSYAWYMYLDHCMPSQNVQNTMMKVLLNQIILGPSVIACVFAWNNLWLGRLAELPNTYKKDALPTLLTGFRFWIPVSIVNFWLVPLHARVAFMSMGSIFWNFYLSSTMIR